MPKLSLSVLALSLVVAGTAAAQKPAAEKAGAAKTAAAPSGTYSTTIVRADVPAAMPKAMADSITGAWSLTFAAGKPVLVKRNGKEVVSSPVTFSGGQMRLSADDTGPDKCNAAAVYSYSEKNGMLTFKVDGVDACDGRQVVLTKHPLKRGA